MWSVHVVTLLLFCYACLSTGNDGVRFVSKNFYNVLHWDHVEPTFPGQKVLYSVQYWRDDEKQYWIKHECQNISHLSCDLTAETPSVYDVHYRAKVMVNGSCLDVTTFFIPFRDTVLGPPLLSLHTTASTLQVNVTLPQGPNGVSIADIIASSKKGSLKVVPEYTLKITHPQWAAQVIKSTTGHFNVNLKYNQSVYCGDVVYIPTPEWGRSVSENASFCVTLPDDPRIPLLWPLLGVAVLAAIVIISAVCTCNYVKGEKHRSMPEVLVTPPQKCKVMEHQDKNLRVSEVVVGIHSDQNQSKVQMSDKHSNVSKRDGYFPQASPICQYNPDTSTQSSESYGAVAAQTHVEGNKGDSHQFGRGNRQPTNPTLPYSEEVNKNKGGISPQFTSYRAPQLPIVTAGESNPEEEPLVLTTVTPPQKCKVMEHQDKNLRVSELVVGIHSDQNQSKVQMSDKHSNVSERDGYFPQASPICQYNPDTSTRSSESYGAVAAQTHVEGNKGDSHQFGRGNRQPTNPTLPCSEEVNKDKGGISPQFTSYRAPQLPIVMAGESNPEEEPLVLTTVRNIDGQLVLWPFTFGLQSRPGNLESHLDTERKSLLLDDIICQDGPLSLERLDSLDGRDSGFFGSIVNTPTGSCFNSNYSNSETIVPCFQLECQTMLPGDTVFQSGYKKNWMPENPPGPTDIH